MSKKSHQSKEFIVDSDASDSGSEEVKPAKKVKLTPKATVEDDFFDLGKNRRLAVREFKGMTFIDIREFYNANGELKPGKKGISLTIDQWEKLKTYIADIDKAIKKE